MPEVPASSLYGSWVHAHEEDSDTEMVFRPADHELPPSRGRLAFALAPDGSFSERAPGPTDRPEEGEGSWELLGGDTLVMQRKAEAEPVRTMRIASAESDRLVVRK